MISRKVKIETFLSIAFIVLLLFGLAFTLIYYGPVEEGDVNKQQEKNVKTTSIQIVVQESEDINSSTARGNSTIG